MRTPRRISSLGTRFAFALTILVLAGGCSKDHANRGAIQGEVKLDGRPIEEGSILFTPVDGTKGTVAGTQIEKGHYRIAGHNGPALGWNSVAISTLRKTGRMVEKPMAPPGQMVEEYVEAVPTRFNSESTLKFEVKPGENTADFEVNSK
jgi:hypothetical protein